MAGQAAPRSMMTLRMTRARELKEWQQIRAARARRVVSVW